MLFKCETSFILFFFFFNNPYTFIEIARIFGHNRFFPTKLSDKPAMSQNVQY